MRRDEIIPKAKEILAGVQVQFPEYNPTLDQINFSINSRMTASAGRAMYRFKLIELSEPIFTRDENDEGFKDTVLHEIAHILTPGKQHGYAWQWVARRIGGTGERCHTLKCERRKKGVRHTVTCPICNEPMKLGPTQYRRWTRLQEKYCHKKCLKNIRHKTFS